MARKKDAGEQLADVEELLTVDQERLEGVHYDVGEGDQSGRSLDEPTLARIDAAFLAIDHVTLRAELIDSSPSRRDKQRAGETRSKLVYALHVAKTAVKYHGLDLAQPELQTLIREVANAEREFNTWADTGVWPLTISPSGPVRPGDTDVADDTDDAGPVRIPKTEWEDMIDAIPQTSVFSSTAGKVAVGMLVVLAVRWVMK